MASDSLGSFIHRLSNVYREPQRVLGDAEALLSSPLGSHLRPTTEPLMLNDGSSTPPVLLLRGTLPIKYRGITYNIPIDMYLPPPYPLRPPTVFIRPVATMAIKKNHRHVGLDGRVYLPYLHEWRPTTHDLRELATWMSSLFGAEPPCYAKPVGSATVSGSGQSNNSPPPPPYPAHSHTSSNTASSSGNSFVSTAASSVMAASILSNNAEERRAAQKQKSADDLAANIARIDLEEKEQMKVEQIRLEKEHESNLLTMRAIATRAVQSEIHKLCQGVKEELRLELKNQKQLDSGKDQIEHLMKEGEERKTQLQEGNNEIEKATEDLEAYLAAVKEEQDSAASTDNNIADSKADLIAIPADTHSAQMLALSAENAAIDDCIYFLDQALVRGSITSDVFLKEVRRLSKSQFLAKAHLIKIAQTRAAEHR